jgi:glutamate-1-semialdehyde 2,1-aminomutase
MAATTLHQAIDRELQALHRRYVEANPESAASFAKAQGTLPGGNTRSVLHFNPFPLSMRKGSGAHLEDFDGHRYLDCVGEFSAGIYGHSDPDIVRAIRGALERGIVLAAPTELERELAELLRARIPSLERLRFCNSGTEANLFAVATAIALSGRRKVMAFRDGYHGGVMSFGRDVVTMNVPHDFVMQDYNDGAGAAAAIRALGPELAAVIVEPILGAGGNIPATRAFLQALRDATRETGAVLIFDEVKTSRMGSGAMQGRIGVTPDMTTLGKYIGGGLPLGAFGGRADLMDRFDPARADAIKHAGTFNNNVCSLSAGIAGLSKVFTPERADALYATSEALREAMNRAFAAKGLPMQFVGRGSMFSLHFVGGDVTRPSDIPAHSRKLGELMHMHALLAGVLMCARSDIFLSLPMTAQDHELIEQTALGFAQSYPDLIGMAAEASRAA